MINENRVFAYERAASKPDEVSNAQANNVIQFIGNQPGSNSSNFRSEPFAYDTELFSPSPSQPLGASIEGSEMSDQTREEVDAKVAAAEARTDTKFERLLGRIDTLVADVHGEFKSVNARLDGINLLVSSTKTNIWGAAAVIVAALALAFAVALTIGPWAYNLGQARATVQTQATGQLRGTSPPTSRQAPIQLGTPSGR